MDVMDFAAFAFGGTWFVALSAWLSLEKVTPGVRVRVSAGMVLLGAFWVALAQGAVASMTVGPKVTLLFGALLFALLLFIALLVEYGPRGLLSAALLALVLVVGLFVLLFLLAPPATPWPGGGR